MSNFGGGVAVDGARASVVCREVLLARVTVGIGALAGELTCFGDDGLLVSTGLRGSSLRNLLLLDDSIPDESACRFAR